MFGKAADYTGLGVARSAILPSLFDQVFPFEIGKHFRAPFSYVERRELVALQLAPPIQRDDDHETREWSGASPKAQNLRVSFYPRNPGGNGWSL